MTIIETIEKEFEEEFAKLCIVNKFGENKYWKPDAQGYSPEDMEASLDKFFPERVKEKIAIFLHSALLRAYEAGLKENVIKVDKSNMKWLKETGEGIEFLKSLMADAKKEGRQETLKEVVEKAKGMKKFSLKSVIPPPGQKYLGVQSIEPLTETKRQYNVALSSLISWLEAEMKK